MSEWHDEFDPDELEDAYRRVVQAEGLVRSALSILDGRGGGHRDSLASAYHELSLESVAFKGAKELAKEAEP